MIGGGLLFLKKINKNNLSFTHISEWTRLFHFFLIYIVNKFPIKTKQAVCLCEAFVSTACSVNPHGSDGSVTETQIYIL